MIVEAPERMLAVAGRDAARIGQALHLVSCQRDVNLRLGEALGHTAGVVLGVVRPAQERPDLRRTGVDRLLLRAGVAEGGGVDADPRPGRGVDDGGVWPRRGVDDDRCGEQRRRRRQQTQQQEQHRPPYPSPQSPGRRRYPTNLSTTAAEVKDEVGALELRIGAGITSRSRKMRA